MGKQRWERELLRTDPLEFPNMAPPGKLSHFHGRWRTTNVSGQARWVSYPPATFYEMFDLPPNLPQDDLHWYGRRLPGTEVEFADASDASALIAAVQTQRGMSYDPDNPMGPPLRQMPNVPEPPFSHIPPDSKRSPMRFIEAYRQMERKQAPTPAPAAVDSNHTPTHHGGDSTALSDQVRGIVGSALSSVSTQMAKTVKNVSFGTNMKSSPSDGSGSTTSSIHQNNLFSGGPLYRRAT